MTSIDRLFWAMWSELIGWIACCWLDVPLCGYMRIRPWTGYAGAVAAVMAARLLTRFLIRMVVSFRYVVVFCDRLLVSLAVRAFTHAARLVDTTDATSNRPVMMLMTSEVTFARRRALARTPMRRTPGITP